MSAAETLCPEKLQSLRWVHTLCVANGRTQAWLAGCQLLLQVVPWAPRSSFSLASSEQKAALALSAFSSGSRVYGGELLQAKLPASHSQLCIEVSDTAVSDYNTRAL